MWRALAFVGAAWIAAVGPTFACEDPDDIAGIIYETLPNDTPPDAIVLDVVFEAARIAQWRGGPIEARVRRVVQGDFAGDHVRVSYFSNSCLYPFVFGTEGLIIVRRREGYQVLTLNGRAYPSGERVTREIRVGFEGVWFEPIAESIRKRRGRVEPD